MLSVAPTEPAVAELIPAGVAASNGEQYFISSRSGIDALDAATGAVVWSTTEAHVPVLALGDTLLAIRGAEPVDGAWRGRGLLVAIDRAAPHAVRRGQEFDLPLDRHRLLDAHIEAGSLVSGWHASAGDGSPLRKAPPDVRGSIRIDLMTGIATLAAGTHVPVRVHGELATTSSWLPAWRSCHGWSALTIGGTATAASMMLRHWPDTADARSIVLLTDLDPSTTRALNANARHAFVSTSRSGPHGLQVYDAETGVLAHTFTDVLHGRFRAPFALSAGRLLAVERTSVPGRDDRALVMIDASAATHEPRWRYPLAPELSPGLRPSNA
jgi:hypothetical protein